MDRQTLRQKVRQKISVIKTNTGDDNNNNNNFPQSGPALQGCTVNVPYL